MKISVVLTPAEIVRLPETDLAGVTAVVFDILRATSTMTTAFAHGVSAIFPVENVAAALALKEKHPAALLGGERHGEKIAGFDLGNSPLEYRALRGREIISTTTNGTVALRAVAHAETVIAGALLNTRGVAEFLKKKACREVLLVCAGTGSEYALEDGLAAGALLEAMGKKADALDDAGAMLRRLWQANAQAPLDVLASSRNGRRLIAAGRQAEVEWCAQVDVCAVCGVLQGEALRVL